MATRTVARMVARMVHAGEGGTTKYVVNTRHDRGGGGLNGRGEAVVPWMEPRRLWRGKRWHHGKGGREKAGGERSWRGGGGKRVAKSVGRGGDSEGGREGGGNKGGSDGARWRRGMIVGC
jgi:hypothetical protein